MQTMFEEPIHALPEKKQCLWNLYDMLCFCRSKTALADLIYSFVDIFGRNLRLTNLYSIYCIYWAFVECKLHLTNLHKCLARHLWDWQNCAHALPVEPSKVFAGGRVHLCGKYIYLASFPGPTPRAGERAWFQPFVHALNRRGVSPQVLLVFSKCPTSCV